MKPLLALALAVVASLPAAHADPILEWNDVIGLAQRTEPMGPTFGSRSYAIVHAAMYDAVNAVSGRYRPYALNVPAMPGASQAAAAAQAAHDALLGLYPGQQSVFDAKLAMHLAAIPDSPGKTAGIQLGQQAASAILANRANDQSNAMMNYTPGNAPGNWQPDPLNPLQMALTPDWGKVTPFVLANAAQFRPGPPPSLNSPEYTAAFNEVKSLGEKSSMTRTAEQTEIGLFWAYDVGGVGPPPILYNQIAQTIANQQGNSLEQNARLFALLNLAQADAGIATWEAKYVYNFWRPVNAIRAIGSYADGNMATLEDSNWVPLGAPGDGLAPDFTPPFPAYTSGHAAFGAAMFRTLANFYGADNMSFVLDSDEFDVMRMLSVERNFTSFGQAAEENALSRIYLGIHWLFDATEGVELGNRVADYTFANVLLPVPLPGTLFLLMPALMMMVLRRRTA